MEIPDMAPEEKEYQNLKKLAKDTQRKLERRIRHLESKAGEIYQCFLYEHGAEGLTDAQITNYAELAWKAAAAFEELVESKKKEQCLPEDED